MTNTTPEPRQFGTKPDPTVPVPMKRTYLIGYEYDMVDDTAVYRTDEDDEPIPRRLTVPAKMNQKRMSALFADIHEFLEHEGTEAARALLDVGDGHPQESMTQTRFLEGFRLMVAAVLSSLFGDETVLAIAEDPNVDNDEYMEWAGTVVRDLGLEEAFPFFRLLQGVPDAPHASGPPTPSSGSGAREPSTSDTESSSTPTPDASTD